MCENNSYDDCAERVEILNSVSEDLYNKFIKFILDMAEMDETWKFWHGFVFHDCLVYIGLYTSIRSGNWTLRLSSLKEMCPLLTAYDRVNYLKNLPQHFAELMSLPESIKCCLKEGGFVFNIKGKSMSALGIDEAHECLINKDIKTTIVRPSKEYLDRLMYYYPIRTKLCKQVIENTLPTKNMNISWKIVDTTPLAGKSEENIKAMLPILADNHVFKVDGVKRTLIAIDGTSATPEQRADLTSFRSIGFDYYIAHVRYFIMREPTASVPMCLCRLQTFCPPRIKRKKTKQKEHEQNLVTACMRRQMAMGCRNKHCKRHTLASI